MKKNYLTIIFSTSLVFNMLSIQDTNSGKMITLIFGTDEKRIRVPYDVIFESGTIRGAIERENHMEEEAEDELYLPEVSSEAGSTTIELLNELKQDSVTIYQKVVARKLHKNSRNLTNLINAADYLNIPNLLEPLSRYASFQLHRTTILDEVSNLPDDIKQPIFDRREILIKNIETAIKCDQVKNYTASSDGSLIVAHSWHDNLYFFTRSGNLIKEVKDRKYNYLIVSSDGSKAVARGYDTHLYVFDKLGRPIITFENHYDLPVVSSDGSTVVARGLEEDPNLYILDTIHKVSRVVPIECCHSPVVSPDGSTIVAIGPNGLYIFDKFGRIVKELNNKIFRAPIISADGSFIVMSRTAGSNCVHPYIFDKFGNLIKAITDREYHSPVISADGSTIVAKSKIANSEGGYLYIFDKFGNLIKAITDREYHSQIISADGSIIVADRFGTGHLDIFDKSGNLIKAITDREYHSPVISTDGSTVVATRAWMADLYIFDKFGNLIKAITDRGYRSSILSSDGFTIIAGGQGGGGLYILKLSGIRNKDLEKSSLN